MASARPPTRARSASRPSTGLAQTVSESGNTHMGDWIVALLQARGTGTAREVGVAALEKDLGQAIVTQVITLAPEQYSDSATFVKSIHLLKSKPPSVVLVPSSAMPSARAAMAGVEGAPAGEGVTASEATMLVRTIQEACPEVPVIGIMRKYWNEQLTVHDDERISTLTSVKPKYYALSAACALFKYLETQSLTFSPRSLLIRYAPLEGTCLIDADSAKNLELVGNVSLSSSSLTSRRRRLTGERRTQLLNRNSKQHLLGMLNKCLTPMGTRLLRANILAPLTQPTIIDTRLDVVEELVNSEERFHALRKGLEPLKKLDLDKITSRIISSSSSTKLSASSSHPSFSRPSRLPKSTTVDPSASILGKLTSLLLLRTFLLALPVLRMALESAESTILRQVTRILEDESLEVVRRVVEENVNRDLWAGQDAALQGRKGRGGGTGGESAVISRHARLFAIKAEKKLLCVLSLPGLPVQQPLPPRARLIFPNRLDVARETYRENLNDAHELCDSLREKHGLDLSLQSTASGTFLFQCAREDWEEKGAGMWRYFVSVVRLSISKGRGRGLRGDRTQNKKGKRVEFTSLDLKKRNARIAESMQEILLMSDEILDEIFDDVRGSIGCLYRSSDAIALLDMLASLAEISSKNEYSTELEERRDLQAEGADSWLAVRPEWTDTLAIKAGRHPLHEQFRMSDGSFVPNDTYASDAASFQLISGSNMSGKSTLLRQIALLHVMGQIGCFVPALYASFRPISALLTRLSNDDNLEASLSTFAAEMSTMNMILAALAVNEERPALVIVDELGRGTSPEEGVGIAHAIAEEIIRSKAFCFFATHFKELSTTLSCYSNVVSLHLETERCFSQIDRSKPDFSLTFHHRVVDGQTPLTHYGLELAKIAKLPTPVLDKAHLISATLESLQEDNRARSSSTKLARRRRELLRVRTCSTLFSLLSSALRVESSRVQVGLMLTLRDRQLKTTLKELAQSKHTEGSALLATLKELQDETTAMLSETLGFEDELAGREQLGGADEKIKLEQGGEDVVAGAEAQEADGKQMQAGESSKTPEHEMAAHAAADYDREEDELAPLEDDEGILEFD
ncbi:SPOSA6832_01105, partial [Sporobolomyces salmonicolor]